MTATASPTCRTVSKARIGWRGLLKLCFTALRQRFGKATCCSGTGGSARRSSAPVTVRTTPGMAAAADMSTEMIRACASGLRTMAACSIPGNSRSPTKMPRPVSKRRSSRRSTDRPTYPDETGSDMESDNLPSPSPGSSPLGLYLVHSHPGAGATVSAIRARSIHVRGPALVEAPLVLLGDAVGEHSRTVVGPVLLAEAHLVVVGVAPRDDTFAGEGGVVPVLHVVLLGHPSRTRIAQVVVPEHVLHLRRCIAIDQEPAPRLGPEGPARVPDGDGARLASQVRHVGEHVADQTEEARLLPEPSLALLVAVPEVLLDDRRVLVARRVRDILQLEERHRTMPEVGERSAQPLGGVEFGSVAAARTARPDTREVDRAVADVVVGVPGEVLGRKFPVARHHPLLHPAQDLRAAFTPIATVQQRVQVKLHAAQIFRERRRGLVPRCPDRALVIGEPRDFHQPPLGSVQLFLVALLVVRHAHKSPVGGVATAVIGTREHRSIALVVATHFHASMPTRVQKDMNAMLPIPGEDDRLLAHARDEIVTGL